LFRFQIWRLIHNLELVEWVQRIAPAMPLTSKLVDGVKWATVPVRRALRVGRIPGRPLAAIRNNFVANRAAREAVRRKLAADAARAAVRKRWSLLYPVSPVLSPLVRGAQGQARFLSRQVDGGSKFLYRQLYGGAAAAATPAAAQAAKLAARQEGVRRAAEFAAAKTAAKAAAARAAAGRAAKVAAANETARAAAARQAAHRLAAATAAGT